MMSAFDDKLRSVMMPGSGRDSRPRPTPVGFVEATIVSYAPEGVRFTVDRFDGGRHTFGPAPVALTGPEPTQPPPPGTRCLVVFVGAGTGTPWVVGWHP
jgi:hypothetical protein